MYLACDAANKGGMHYMVKKLAAFDLHNDKLDVIVLDSNVCEGTNTKTAEAIDFSLQKVDVDGTKSILNRQSTDAGGGGTNVSLGHELKNLNRTTEEYLLATCYIQLTKQQSKAPWRFL